MLNLNNPFYDENKKIYNPYMLIPNVLKYTVGYYYYINTLNELSKSKNLNEENLKIKENIENYIKKFPNIKLLSKKYNIDFVKAEKTKHEPGTVYEIYGYPTPHRPHNVLFDVQKHLPIFTKTAKSKSFFCAGYYIVKYSSTWVRAYCPKMITLNRYEYQGPFKSAERMLEAMKEANGQ